MGNGENKKGNGLNEYDNCFACGQSNPWGLKLKFSYDGEWASAPVVFHKNYEGYPDVIHGGIITTVLDEAMAKAMLFQGKVAYTVEIKVKFRKKAVPGQIYKVYGRLLSSRRNLHNLEAFLKEGERVIAEANAIFYSLS